MNLFLLFKVYFIIIIIIDFFYRISNPDRGDKLLKTLANIINVEFKFMVNAR